MAHWLLANAGILYGAAIVGGFLAVAVWETYRPFGKLSTPLGARWLANLGLLAINQTSIAFVVPVLGLGAALAAEQRGWGLLNVVAIPAPIAVVLGVVALDFLHWGTHYAMHRVELLWRLHQVHHSDVDYDCSLNARFHPLEALVTLSSTVAVVVALGIAPLAVLTAEVATVGFGYFAHGNVRLSGRFDSLVRLIFVTPAMHRVHHSVRFDDSQSNFGSVLSCWDRLLGTYRTTSAQGLRGVSFGLSELRDPRELTLLRLLWLPFARRPR